MKLSAIRVLGLAMGLSACTTVVRPPSGLSEPVRVALIDHGKHASLVIGTESGMIRYAYGDWRYYAEAETGFFSGLAALFWPTRAALGRKTLKGAVEKENLFKRLYEGAEDILVFEVEASRARLLVSDLENIYFGNIGSQLYNRHYDLDFVHHPRDYSLFHNSNRLTGKWLRELGCEVEGLAWLSRWKLTR